MHRSALRRAFRRYAPFWMGRALRAVYYFAGDLRDSVLQRRDPLMPPRGQAAFIGDGDFAGLGRRFLDHFVTLGNLQPHHRVLDVGCGIGRMAVPLTGYLAPQGEYWGFDPVASGIEWCREHISSRYPNFHFYLAEVWSRSYNRRGQILAREYVFPHDARTFDFVFATSVFTHMVPADVENYVRNIARVLKPGGTTFATYYLLNPTTRQSPAAADFRYPVDADAVCMAVSKVEFEKAVAFDERYVRELYARCGLVVREPIHFGRWATQGGGPAFQDILIAHKPE